MHILLLCTVSPVLGCGIVAWGKVLNNSSQNRVLSDARMSQDLFTRPRAFLLFRYNGTNFQLSPRTQRYDCDMLIQRPTVLL